MAKKILARGELSNFLFKHADFTTKDPGEEIDRLLSIANAAGIATTRLSLSVTFYRLRKEQELQELKNQTDPPADQQRKEEPPEKPAATITPLPPLITAPAKPYQPKTPTIITAPAESIVAPGEEWFDSKKSAYVSFFANPAEGEQIKTENINGRVPYAGRIAGRPDSKIVLPLAQTVIGHITTELKRTGRFSVLLPCFLINKPTYWIAREVDLERLEAPRESQIRQKIDELSKRMQFLESKVMQLLRVVEEVDKRTAIQDLLIVFDFQNFSASFRDRGTPIHPRYVIDKAAHFETFIPRRVVKVVIVDFTSSRGKIYCEGNNYDFYPVPEFAESEKNPTDQFIYQATCQYVNELKLPQGSLIALVSGDGHFLPLLCDLKNAGYQIMTVGREGYIHQSMKDADFCLILS